MKPTPGLLFVVLAAVSGLCLSAQAQSLASYVYDASVLNWYQASEHRPAFSKFTYSPEGTLSPFSVESHTSMLYVNIPKAVAANDALVGASAGAIWEAPQGERVVKVQLTYAAVLSPYLNLAVYGDTGNGRYDVEIGRMAPGATTDNRAKPTRVVFAVPAGIAVTKVKVRAYELVKTAGLGAGWSDQIRAVAIETAPLP